MRPPKRPETSPTTALHRRTTSKTGQGPTVRRLPDAGAQARMAMKRAGWRQKAPGNSRGGGRDPPPSSPSQRPRGLQTLAAAPHDPRFLFYDRGRRAQKESVGAGTAGSAAQHPTARSMARENGRRTLHSRTRALECRHHNDGLGERAERTGRPATITGRGAMLLPKPAARNAGSQADAPSRGRGQDQAPPSHCTSRSRGRAGSAMDATFGRTLLKEKKTSKSD